MTNPVTHLLFSWVLAAILVRKPESRLLVVASGVFMDVDIFFDHHGFVHTPLFALFIFFAIFLLTKRIRLSAACLCAMGLHLFLDTIATRAPVMLLYPLTTIGYCLGADLDNLAFISLKLTLALLALSLTYYFWRKGESPVDMVEWLKNNLGSKIAYFSLFIFFTLLVYGTYKYVIKFFSFILNIY